MAIAFEPKPGSKALSTNWLEYFPIKDIEEGVQHVRDAFKKKNYDVKEDGRFAVLNVGDIKEAFRIVVPPWRCSLIVKHTPQDNDPSHADIIGYSSDEDAVAQALAELVDKEDIYAAVVTEN